LHAANFSKMKGGRGFGALLTPARAGRIPSHIILFGRSDNTLLKMLSFAKNRPGGKPCSIMALANEMNQVKGRVTIAPDNHVTQRYVPPHPASRFSRTARYRFGKVGFSFRCIFGEPQGDFPGRLQRRETVGAGSPTSDADR